MYIMKFKGLNQIEYDKVKLNRIEIPMHVLIYLLLSRYLAISALIHFYAKNCVGDDVIYILIPMT